MSNLKKLVDIHNICFEDKKDYNYFEGLNIKDIFIYEDKAYLVLIDSIDIYEIFEIAVIPEERKKGIATKLLNMISYDKEVFLEVVEDNNPAISLYKKNGFTIISKRKNYYGKKSALIMKK